MPTIEFWIHRITCYLLFGSGLLDSPLTAVDVQSRGCMHLQLASSTVSHAFDSPVRYAGWGAVPWISTPQTPHHSLLLLVNVACSGTFPSNFTSMLCVATEVPFHVSFCSVEMDTVSLAPLGNNLHSLEVTLGWPAEGCGHFELNLLPTL